jgi:hypothetical protein
LIRWRVEKGLAFFEIAKGAIAQGESCDFLDGLCDGLRILAS